ncbi:hypothetical protein IMZ31_23955 (plasmid) [Pontibacillus sp. ALD_SL1]|uniref:hypothetical protein n=1 Tax=Pontibacillus sp. ALD_SL1 TaxID=2777185 RepID=UPI001A95BA36|nr:hypothetical protein [Pontibacillus sp. ALD_SL1]QST02507.1 hypothetical protein IMZ31_23955 [Pontibacillus sp. ALD_SL1]
MGKPNDWIIGKPCLVTSDFLIRVRKRRMKKRGIIRGYYLTEYWHPYVYKAFHVELEDGTRDTFPAKDVTILEEKDKDDHARKA